MLACLLCLCAHARAADAANTVTVLLAGDMMFDRGVHAQMQRHGGDYIFSGITDLLHSADFVAGNLECPLTDADDPRQARVVFRCEPSAAALMADAGFHAVTLANNHILDQGAAGVEDTLKHLADAGLGAAGTSLEPWIQEINGVRVGLLAFVTPDVAGDLPEGPGPVVATEQVVTDAVTAARQNCDVLIVSFHWGREYKPTPIPAQRDLARAAAHAGADLIFGHHPHVLQPVEMIPIDCRAGTPIPAAATNSSQTSNGGNRRSRPTTKKCPDVPVIYSLGNFVFDQREPERNRGAMVRAVFSKGGIEELSLLPVAIERCRPAPAPNIKPLDLF